MSALGYGFPSSGQIRIASASGSNSGNLLISSASFSPSVNVKVDDVIIFNVRLNGTTGAAAGTHMLALTKGGTATLEHTSSGLGNIWFSTGEVPGSIAVTQNYTMKYRVTAAGTFTGVGCSAITTHGTATTSQSTEHYTEVWRVATNT